MSDIVRKSGPVVILPARGRRLTWQGAAVVAEIGMGWGEPTNLRLADDDARAYAHPTVRLRLVGPDGEVSLYGLDVQMSYQRHAPAKGPGDQTRANRGWATTTYNQWGQWSKAYAGDIKAHFSGPLDGKRLAKAMRIIERAREASEGTKAARTGDAVVALAIGLRMIGVEVRVWSERVKHERSFREGR